MRKSSREKQNKFIVSKVISLSWYTGRAEQKKRGEENDDDDEKVFKRNKKTIYYHTLFCFNEK